MIFANHFETAPFMAKVCEVDTMHHSFKGFTSYQHRLQQNIAAVIHASATASTDAIDEKFLAVN